MSQPELPVRRTRRAVIAAGLGALAATVAEAVTRPSTASAATTTFSDTSNPVVQVTAQTPGATALSVTTTSTSVTGSTGIVSFGGGPNGIGVYGNGMPGVLGITVEQSASGVEGRNTAGTGSGPGIKGTSDAPNGLGVWGEAQDTGSNLENYGVFGLTHSSLGRGVFGWNLSTGGGAGVWGQTNAGTGAGVRGYAWDADAATGQFGTGVIGTSGSHAFPPPAARANTGVMGLSPTGTGVYAEGATALQAKGKVKVNRSGRATVPANASSVSVSVPGGLSGTPLAFATLMTSRSGVYVRAVTASSTTGKITILLNKVASTMSGTSVAWVVLG